MMENNKIIFRLFLAALLGGLIGTEREVSKRPAGVRTHILVTIGSTLIMIVSQENIDEPFRLAAQVVSGIGFLGAGTIIQRKGGIDGLTTAASLWVSAGIGLAVGVGNYLAAITVVIIVLLTLMGVGIYERIIYNAKHKTIVIVTRDVDYKIDEIRKVLIDKGVKIKAIARSDNNLEMAGEDIEGSILTEIKVLCAIPKEYDLIELMDSLLEIDSIYSVSIGGIGRKIEEI